MKRILVVDAQGGGLGRALIEKLKAADLGVEILAVGTNAVATGAMLKAGADAAATGENAVAYNAGRADIIVGGAGILCANAMLGEISPAMAAAISQSNAYKLLVPIDRCKLRIAGAADLPLPAKVDAAVQEAQKLLAELGQA